MTPWPIYRWKSFWLGVLVLGALWWAWSRSMTRSGIVAFGSTASKECWQVGSGAAAIHYYYTDLTNSYFYTAPEGWVFESSAKRRSFNSYPAAIKAHHSTDLLTVTQVKIAYWFLIILFLVPWVSFLAWRWRRMGRLAVGSVEPAAGSGV
jgi:hypothetical protein